MADRSSFLIAVLALGLTAAGAAAQTGQDHGAGPGMMGGMMGRHLMQRHMAFMRGDVPPRYRDLANPLSATPATLSRGAALYRDNCLSCHGAQGHGDGEAGRSLAPPPADIAQTARMPMPDGFFFWTISDGGQAFGTAMPSFRDTVEPDAIWAIITYLRAGLPGDADSPAPWK